MHVENQHWSDNANRARVINKECVEIDQKKSKAFYTTPQHGIVGQCELDLSERQILTEVKQTGKYLSCRDMQIRHAGLNSCISHGI